MTSTNTTTSHDALAAERWRFDKLGFQPGRVIARTGKSLLVEGSHESRPAVAKLLTSDERLWRERFAAELHAYEILCSGSSPVRMPVLYADDLDRGLLVVERIVGEPAASERHLSAPLAADVRRALLDAVEALGRWDAPACAFPQVFDYPERFDRYATHGLFDADDVERLTRLARRAVDGAGWSFAHGDPLPSQFLLPPGAGSAPVLIDWEWAGLYLPGFDAALLWLVAAADPDLRGALVAAATRHEAAEAGFWVNVATVATREIRTHRELPDSAMRTARLAQLGVDWTACRAQIAAMAD